MTEETKTFEFAIIIESAAFKYVVDTENVSEEDSRHHLMKLIMYAVENGTALVIQPTNEHPPTTIIRFGDKAVVQIVPWAEWEKRTAEQQVEQQKFEQAQRRQNLTLPNIVQNLQRGPRRQ